MLIHLDFEQCLSVSNGNDVPIWYQKGELMKDDYASYSVAYKACS